MQKKSQQINKYKAYNIQFKIFIYIYTNLVKTYSYVFILL